MANDGSDGLFEVHAGAGGEPFERDGLRQVTNFQSRAPRAGADFKQMAMARLQQAGAVIERLDFEVDGFPVDALVRGVNDRRFLVLARGTPDDDGRRPGLRRSDTVEKVGFMAIQLGRRQPLPILIITSDLPKRATRTGHYLASLSSDVWDVVAHRADLRGFQRLRRAFQGPTSATPPSAPWRDPIPADQLPLFDDFDDSDEQQLRLPAVNDENHQQ